MYTPPDVNRSQYSPNAALINSYDQNNDVRVPAYFAVIPDNAGDDRVVLSKYLAKAASTTKPDGVVNFKALRVGEMYLIRAEACEISGSQFCSCHGRSY